MCAECFLLYFDITYLDTKLTKYLQFVPLKFILGFPVSPVVIILILQESRISKSWWHVRAKMRWRNRRIDSVTSSMRVQIPHLITYTYTLIQFLLFSSEAHCLREHVLCSNTQIDGSKSSATLRGINRRFMQKLFYLEFLSKTGLLTVMFIFKIY